MPTSLLIFLIDNSHLLVVKLLEHIYFVFSAVLMAVLIGVPLGICITYHNKLKNIILSITNIFQTIPSLALLAFLIPILGIGMKPTIVALTIYALLPIVRNTFIGLQNVPIENIEAANGLGFTHWQRIRMVELPLAIPVIVSGIRIATAMTIGITTIAATIGAGGLGDFITEGLALNNTRLILLGAIPAALLALILDMFIGRIEKLLSHKKKIASKKQIQKIALIVVLSFTMITVLTNFMMHTNIVNKKNSIIVATKNFSEQFILGNIISDMITTKTHLHVIKKFNLGSTIILQNALLKKSVDVYPEYTGTAYIVILNHETLLSPEKTYQTVKKEYLKRYDLIWLAPFGFNNSQMLATTQSFAQDHGMTNLSQLANMSGQLSIAAPPEFFKRADALPGLAKVYGFKFKKIFQVQLDLVYQSLKDKAVNVIEVFSTDGRIPAYHLTVLKDDKHFYKPYYAAPVIRSAILKSHPEIAEALKPLAGLIDEKTMRHLNYLVDVNHVSPEKVAHDFLQSKGLLN